MCFNDWVIVRPSPGCPKDPAGGREFLCPHLTGGHRACCFFSGTPSPGPGMRGSRSRPAHLGTNSGAFIWPFWGLLGTHVLPREQA